MSEKTAPSAGLCLNLLGGCEITLLDGPLHLETAKTQALLVYLALNPAPQPRHTLMGLLWGDLPEARARRNLRRALWNLRRQLSYPECAQPIHSDRQTVCLNGEYPHWSDVQAFERFCFRVDPHLPTPDLLQQLAQAREAAALYQGEFLEGVYVNDAAAYEEWVIAERERLRAMALRALEHLIAGLAAQNNTAGALDAARELVALEPWLEEGHRWLMRLLARTGRRAEALVAFEDCKRLLAEELGVEPVRETQVLAEQIRSGALAAPPSNLPASTTAFVGRTRELAEVGELLARADCRLVTITGLGGVGKSRLACEVGAAQIRHHAHGVHYVNLNALAAPSRLAETVAQSLGLPQIGVTGPGCALRAYLRPKQTLLILDGFDQLVESAPLLTEMLQAAPGVKILVTSRERLNTPEEWVYSLEGLECIPRAHDPDPIFSEAARLFLQTARRVSLRFQVNEADQPYLSRICHLVAGLPLAIELAAAWVRLLPLEMIAAQIEQRLDFLGYETNDRPARQRSIRAVFDHSWRLLSDAEREAFRKLSVFQGAFGPGDAWQVCRAPLHTLRALVDRSLLQRTISGRFQLHELLRQYAHEQLVENPGEWEQVRGLHCQVYAAAVSAHRQTKTRVAHNHIVRSFETNRENILAAWQWAIATRNLEAIASMCQALTDVFQLTSAFQEGEVLMREALDSLGWPKDSHVGTAPEALLSWELLSIRAMFLVYLGHSAQARRNLERCMVVFVQLGITERVAHCQYFLGEIARFAGQHDQADACFQESRANYELIGDRAAIGFCLNGLGLVSAASGRFDRARGFLRNSLAAFMETDHEMGQAIVSINLADLLIKLRDYATARAVLDRARGLCQTLGHRWGTAVCLRYLGDIARWEGRAADGKDAYLQSLDILHDIGHRQAAAGCLVKLADLCTELGEYLEAGRYLKRALSITAELEDSAQFLEAATSLIALLAAEGSQQSALLLAILVAQQPAGAPSCRQRANQWAIDLARQLPAEAVERIQSQSTEPMLTGMLAEWALALDA